MRFDGTIAPGVAAFAFAVSVGSGACGSSGPNDATTCGAGTHQSGTKCVADGTDSDGGAMASEAGGSDGSSLTSDAGSDPSTDSGAPVVHNGDPCPGDQHARSACSGNHIFGCEVVNNGEHPLGTLWDVQNCDLLGGTCTLDHVGNASCTGGGYTTCPPTPPDGGAPFDWARCYNATVVEDCSGGSWRAIDCGSAGNLCKDLGGGNASCAPP